MFEVQVLTDLSKTPTKLLNKLFKRKMSDKIKVPLKFSWLEIINKGKKTELILTSNLMNWPFGIHSTLKGHNYLLRWDGIKTWPADKTSVEYGSDMEQISLQYPVIKDQRKIQFSKSKSIFRNYVLTWKLKF